MPMKHQPENSMVPPTATIISQATISPTRELCKCPGFHPSSNQSCVACPVCLTNPICTGYSYTYQHGGSLNRYPVITVMLDAFNSNFGSDTTHL
eukprot:6925898-Ditylum_brightwellii.AAC.1